MLLPDGLTGCLGGEGEQPCKTRHLLLDTEVCILYDGTMLIRTVMKKEEEHQTR